MEAGPIRDISILAILAELQSRIPVINLNKSVKVSTDKGNYSFKYADFPQLWEVLRPLFKEYRLFVNQTMDEKFLTTRIFTFDGQEFSSQILLPVILPTEAQKFGSFVTYFKRYGLVLALGLVADEDDDANYASGNVVEYEQKPKANSNLKMKGTDGRTLISGLSNGKRWYGYTLEDGTKGYFNDIKGGETGHQQFLKYVPDPELQNLKF